MENELLGSVKASSYHVYRRQIGNHLLPQLGNYDLSELTPGVIHGFVEDLEASGLAGSTTKGAYRLLVRCAAFCSGRRHIERIPAEKSKCRHTKQRAACADAARTGAHSLAFPNTGRSFRVAEPVHRHAPGEVCALRWSDIDWEKRTITVRRTAQRVARLKPENGGRTMLMIGSPKSMRSQRVLPVPDFSAGTAEETDGRHGVGICIRRFPTGRRSHARCSGASKG